MTNIFAFAPNGSIIACTLNAPGTWHDSTLAHWGSMYSKLQKCWEDHHGKVLMDSAFASNMYKFIIQSSQNVPLMEGCQAMLLGQQTMSCRQAVEWGMRGLQGSFPRLKDCIIYEENGERDFSKIYYLVVQLQGTKCWDKSNPKSLHAIIE